MIDPHRRRVILIDDDGALASLVERSARTAAPHWNVVASHRLISGLAMATRGVDLIILDLITEDRGLDESIAFIAWFRAHAPVVILTGNRLDIEDRLARCQNAGAAAVWEKAKLNTVGLARFIEECEKIVETAKLEDG